MRGPWLVRSILSRGSGSLRTPFLGARAPLGRSGNFPRSVAVRLGADPARAVLEVTGGQAPQHLVNEFAAAIAAGNSSVVLLAGAEAMSTIRRYSKRRGAAGLQRERGGEPGGPGVRATGLASALLDRRTGSSGGPAQYAVIVRTRGGPGSGAGPVRRTRLVWCALFAPFTSVAVFNPHCGGAGQEECDLD